MRRAWQEKCFLVHIWLVGVTNMGGMENFTLVEVQPDHLSSSNARDHIEYYSLRADLTPLDITMRVEETYADFRNPLAQKSVVEELVRKYVWR